MARKRARQATEDVEQPPLADVNNPTAVTDVAMEPEARAAPEQTLRRAGMADVARRRAAHFAHFQAEEDNDNAGNVHVGRDEARTLGPWSSAVELVNARERAQAARSDKLMSARRESAEGVADVEWQPLRDVAAGPRPQARVRSLFDTCLGLLTEYIDAVESLWGVPDAIRVKLAAAVCQQRRLSPEVGRLFAACAPGEIVLGDCTQLDVPAMTELLQACATSRLERLELTSCGRGLGDSAAAVLEKSGPLPALTVVTLSGAYRLSAPGLGHVLRAAPNLESLSVQSASRLTAEAIQDLPALVPGIRRLNIADCRGISGEALISVIPQLPALHALTVDGIPEVDDAVVMAVVRAPCLRELSICYCQNVTDSAITAVAALRPELESLAIDECGKITDKGILAVAGGCKQLRHLSARRCAKLTDESLAAIASRGALQHLNINGIPGVASATMKAVALCCKDSLQYLDIGFCRNVSESAVGLVADKCHNLHTMLVFGCSQLTNRFLHGHSNESLDRIAGLGTMCSA